jgi:hypothetical protein
MKSEAGPTGVVARKFIHLVPDPGDSDKDGWSLGDIQSIIEPVSDPEGGVRLMAKVATTRPSEAMKKGWVKLYQKHGPAALDFEPLGKYEPVEVKTKGTATRYRTGDASIEEVGEEDVPTYAPSAGYSHSFDKKVEIQGEVYTCTVSYNDSAENVVKAIAGFCIRPGGQRSYVIANPMFDPKVADFQTDLWESEDIQNRVQKAYGDWHRL